MVILDCTGGGGGGYKGERGVRVYFFSMINFISLGFRWDSSQRHAPWIGARRTSKVPSQSHPPAGMSAPGGITLNRGRFTTESRVPKSLSFSTSGQFGTHPNRFCKRFFSRTADKTMCFREPRPSERKGVQPSAGFISIVTVVCFR